MIVTAQPFFNELDLLEIKCEELYGIADLHVVVESPLTFTGLRKPLHFQENKERFASYPILAVTVDLPEIATSPWVREHAQYFAAFKAVRSLNPEIVMWLDTDELPKRDTVDRFRALHTQTAILDMDYLPYYFNRVRPQFRWRSPVISRFNPMSASQFLRREIDFPVLEDSGWHFEYCGGPTRLIDKLQATSHAVEQGAKVFLKKVRAGEFPGGSDTEYPLENLPQFVQQHRDRFTDYFTQ